MAPVAAQAGSLVIVGGGLKADNAAVYRAFIDLVPEDAPTIAVISAASGEPAGSSSDFAKSLSRHGVEAGRVEIIEIAVVDDPETPQIDESLWKNGGESPAEIAKVARAGGIWFTGGDQSRIMQVLKGENGSETAMLRAIRARLAAGAVIGGTSAGAAIMSDPMIACGDPADAVLRPVSRTPADCAPREGAREPLVITTGLGFLKRAIVDQHFSQRSRFGRLARAVACQGVRTGFGIDEDTALIIDVAQRRGQVVGAGGVTMIDARRATGGCDPYTIKNLRVSRHISGDKFTVP